jgi:hypothetical protein
MHLRPLPRLIILDLSGNPLCRETDYRSYVVYHLRKLNVLGTPDGLAGVKYSSHQIKMRNISHHRALFYPTTICFAPIISDTCAIFQEKCGRKNCLIIYLVHHHHPPPDYRFFPWPTSRLSRSDGVPFDAAELAAARDRYDGRVTYEFLMDRIGGGNHNSANGAGGGGQNQPLRPFETLVELDLSNARLRSAEGIEGAARFTSLRCGTRHCNHWQL